MMNCTFTAEELEFDPVVTAEEHDDEPSYLELMQEQGEEHIRIAHSNAKRHRDNRHNHAR